MKRFTLLALLLLLPMIGCSAYKSQEVGFRPPSAYPGMQMANGAQVAAQAFADPAQAKAAFGFDIRKAGLLPVQVVIDNLGPAALVVVPDQSFLIDAEGNYWNLLDSRTAYQRVEGSSEYANIGKGAGKGAFLGAAGGAIVGAAIGILTGENVAETLGKGAAVGAAGGAVIGGADSATSGETGRQIARDLANKELDNKPIRPGILGRGFLFYPGEAPSAGQLRLQLKELESGRLHNLTLPL
jgi:hypothetical protein